MEQVHSELRASLAAASPAVASPAAGLHAQLVSCLSQPQASELESAVRLQSGQVHFSWLSVWQVRADDSVRVTCSPFVLSPQPQPQPGVLSVVSSVVVMALLGVVECFQHD